MRAWCFWVQVCYSARWSLARIPWIPHPSQRRAVLRSILDASLCRRFHPEVGRANWCYLARSSYLALRFYLSRVAFVQTRYPPLSPDDGKFLLLAVFEVATSSRELADEELLGHVCANSFRDADREISKHQPGTTIGSGIARSQVTSLPYA